MSPKRIYIRAGRARTESLLAVGGYYLQNDCAKARWFRKNSSTAESNAVFDRASSSSNRDFTANVDAGPPEVQVLRTATACYPSKNDLLSRFGTFPLARSSVRSRPTCYSFLIPPAQQSGRESCCCATEFYSSSSTTLHQLIRPVPLTPLTFFAWDVLGHIVQCFCTTR